MMSDGRKKGGRKKGVRNNARKIVEGTNSFREVSVIIFYLVLEHCLYNIHIYFPSV